MSDLSMVPHDSPEWDVMWENLKAASGDYSERCPEPRRRILDRWGLAPEPWSVLSSALGLR